VNNNNKFSINVIRRKVKQAMENTFYLCEKMIVIAHKPKLEQLS